MKQIRGTTKKGVLESMSVKTPLPCRSLRNARVFLFSCLAISSLVAGCAGFRPYRVGRISLEQMGLHHPPDPSALSELPADRPLVVSLFSWHASNPVGLKLNLHNSVNVSILEGTYFGDKVHVSLFEAVFDALSVRRRWVFRDHIGATQPGLIPAWARAQKFLVLDGEILRFEHSRIRPKKGVIPPGAEKISPDWGHEAAYVEILFRLRDTVTGGVIMETTIETWTQAVHTENPLTFDPYKALGAQLVQLLERTPSFTRALGGG